MTDPLSDASSADAGTLLARLETLTARGAFPEAAGLWEQAGGGLPSPEREMGEILLLAAGNQRGEARVALERLFLVPGIDAARLKDLRCMLTNCGREILFLEALNVVIRRPDVQPSAVFCWVDEKLAAGSSNIVEALVGLNPETGVRQAALEYFLQCTMNSGQSHLGEALYLRHPDILQSDDRLWALLALNLVSAQAGARAWTADWASRPAAEPWMLRAPAIAALYEGDKEEAFAVSRAALSRGVKDDSFAFHHIVIAMDEYFSGRPEEARASLAAAEAIEMHQWDLTLAQVARSLIESPPERARHLRSLRLDVKAGLAARGLPEEVIVSRILSRLFTGPQPAEQRVRGWVGEPDRPRKGFQPRMRTDGPSPEVEAMAAAAARAREPVHWSQYAWLTLVVSLLFLILYFIGREGAALGQLSTILLALATLVGGLGIVIAGWALAQRRGVASLLVLLGNAISPLAAAGVGLIALMGWLGFGSSSSPGGSLNLASTGTINMSAAQVPTPVPLPETPAPSTADSTSAAERPAEARPQPEAAGTGVSTAGPMVDAEAFERAKSLSHAGRLREALPILREVVEKNPDHPLVQVELSDELRQLGQLDESLAAARRAVALDPEAASGHAALGAVLGAMQQYDEAEKELNEAIRLQPDFYMAYSYLCTVQQMMKRWPEAIQTAEKSISLQPDVLGPWLSLTSALRGQNNWFAAENTVKGLLKSYPESAPGWYALGTVQDGSGMPLAGMRSLRKAVEIRPEFSQAWNTMGILHVRLNEQDKAIECFKKSIELDPNDAEPLNSLGFVFFESGRTEEALPLFEKAFALNPAHPLAPVNLINAHLKLGQRDKAILVCDTLATVNPRMAEEQRARLKATP